MVNYKKIIEKTSSEMFNVADVYKQNSYEENVQIQKSASRKFSVGAINITGCLNIGVMIRSACLLGAENFYIFGRRSFDKRSTVGAENYINIVQYSYDDPMTADEQMARDIQELNHDNKHYVVLCEQDGEVLRGKYNWRGIEHPWHPLFLFGSESHGIPTTVSALGFPKVSIPQVGVLRSFNVSAAMNIIVWDYIKEVYL
jgi:tRNA G18 (ribose-2'-O)-methylase SpoU